MVTKTEKPIKREIRKTNKNKKLFFNSIKIKIEKNLNRIQ
jgi:hypothetical protein